MIDTTISHFGCTLTGNHSLASLFETNPLCVLAQGLGSQAFHNRIFIRVNEWTNSVTEMVANFAAENHLATIVGQKARGNVLGAANVRLGSGYWLRLPVFGRFTFKGHSLESNGLEPNVPLEISPEALAQGSDDQLNKAIEIAKGQTVKNSWRYKAGYRPGYGDGPPRLLR